MSDKNTDDLNKGFSAYLLGRTDSRTIKDIEEKYPELYSFVSMFSEELMEEFKKSKGLGALTFFLDMNLEEIMESKHKLQLLNGRSTEEILALISQGKEASTSSLTIPDDKLKEHLLFEVNSKLENFYKSKMDGSGLKDILIASIKLKKEPIDSDFKQELIGRIGRYETSLKRLEVSKHKKILIDFIEENISGLECELLIEAYEK